MYVGLIGMCVCGVGRYVCMWGWFVYIGMYVCGVSMWVGRYVYVGVCMYVDGYVYICG